ncbi:tail assembly protein [Herbaspirillum autotrophicum]|uniref:tail assembly protein n=1 Tax=Herbaspirillum autotrophicum TaxID=180195 RepID=UPI00067C8C49|nr:tail assembly protein [Herbaspirillum autotrophicum]
MSEKMRTIRLYGTLGTTCGRVHRLAVRSAAEAVHALRIMLPGFERALMSGRSRGITFAVFLGKRNIGRDHLQDPVGDDDIRIAPVIQGSKRGGLLQTVLGAVLIVVGAIMNVPAPGSGAPLIGFGIAMMAGGIVQMLSPQQRGISTRDNVENGASYNFNGPVNTSAQGKAVGLLYGRLMIGSSVISAGIVAEDQA